MSKYTHLSLEERINHALRAAQGAAAAEVSEIDEMIGTGDFLAAFDRGLASSNE